MLWLVAVAAFLAGGWLFRRRWPVDDQIERALQEAHANAQRQPDAPAPSDPE